MSYARWGDESDVYVYESDNTIVCVDCLMDPKHEDFQADNIKQMIDHLEEHKNKKHKVPDEALKRLWQESGERRPRGG